MPAVAKRLVFRMAAAAQGIVLFRFRLVPIRIVQLYIALDIIRPVFGNKNGWFLAPVFMQNTVLGIAQRSGGTHFNYPNRIFRVLGIREYPRFVLHPENIRSKMHTMLPVGAYTPVVMNRDFLSRIIIDFIRNPPRIFFITESDFRMHSVTIGFIIGLTAAAKEQGRRRLQLFAFGVNTFL